MCIAASFLVAASTDQVKSRPPLRWGYLYWLALLAALSHLLLDYTTAYGIRLFEPFDWRWYSWDIVFIIEPVILLVLILGLVMPALFGLINQEIGARSKGPRGRAGRFLRWCASCWSGDFATINTAAR